MPKDDEEIIDGETFLSIAHKLCESIIPKQELDIHNNDESFYQELRECLLNLPPLEEIDNLITTNNIVNHQSTDLPLQRKIQSEPEHYQHHKIEGYEVIHIQSNDENRDPIWITPSIFDVVSSCTWPLWTTKTVQHNASSVIADPACL